MKKKTYIVTIASYEYRTAHIDNASSPEEAIKIAEEMLDCDERSFINNVCSDIYDYGTYVCDEVVEIDD